MDSNIKIEGVVQHFWIEPKQWARVTLVGKYLDSAESIDRVIPLRHLNRTHTKSNFFIKACLYVLFSWALNLLMLTFFCLWNKRLRGQWENKISFAFSLRVIFLPLSYYASLLCKHEEVQLLLTFGFTNITFVWSIRLHYLW